MILSNEKYTIDFDIPEQYKKIMISGSGGADSSILLLLVISYLMENNRDDVEVNVLTCNTQDKAWLVGRKSSDAIDFVLKHTGFKNFNMNYVYYRDTQDVNYFKEVERQLWADKKLDIMITGITLNPQGTDEELLVENRFGVKVDLRDPPAPPNRNGDHDLWRSIGDEGWSYYHPFAKVDKTMIAYLYNYFGVRDSLFPLTRSCERVPDDAGINYDRSFENEPCQCCWWCLERKWGFGEF
jgi:hypothetical protein